MFAFLAVAITAPPVPFSPQNHVLQLPGLKLTNRSLTQSSIPDVPFYSQFKDISSSKWQKVGCGAASVAMIIDFYSSEPVSVNELLEKGVSSGAYLKNVGWTYAGLIQLGKKYGLEGNSYDLGKSSSNAAFAQLEKHLKEGPIIASVHYKFDPKSTIPHLVVIDGIKDGVLYYNDPAAKTGHRQISTADFLKAWKKRFIVIRPEKSALTYLQTPTSRAVSL